MRCASLATEKGFFSREAAGSGSSPIEIRHGLEPTIVLENSRAASTGRVYFIRKQRGERLICGFPRVARPDIF